MPEKKHVSKKKKGKKEIDSERTGSQWIKKLSEATLIPPKILRPTSLDETPGEDIASTSRLPSEDLQLDPKETFDEETLDHAPK